MFKTVTEIVACARQKNASDIHLSTNQPPKYRIQGQLYNMLDEPLTHEQCEIFAKQVAGNAYESMTRIGELDLAVTFGNVRTRINVFRQQFHVSLSIRLLSDNIPKLGTLGVPEVVKTFPMMQRGIVLVTGETGSGKSTTLAALINEINHTRRDHIITLEDPIEYVYHPDKALINQREVGKDTESYANGLRAILREDPDVILIGEMRDLITIETALTAAETGHLVFSTLHTNSAASTVDRIVEVFPGNQQKQIRTQLAATLNAVLSQQLLPCMQGGRILAAELMVVNPAIRNLIRSEKTEQIPGTIQTSASDGSVTMDNCLINLVAQGKISRQQAIESAHDPDFVKKTLVTGGSVNRH